MKFRNFLTILFISSSIFAQDGALGSTRLQQSPLLIGAGQVGAALPNDDVIGFYYNPSILGHTARYNHASIFFMPNRTLWAKFGNKKYTFHNYGLNLGYNLKTTSINLPISIGIGIVHNIFDFDEHQLYNDQTNTFSSKTVDIYDDFTAYSIGIGIDYFVKFNLGFSLKSFESVLGGSLIDGRVQKYSASGSMFDYGMMLTVPVSDLLLSKTNLFSSDNVDLSPITNFSIGYSQLDIGDEIYYIDPAQSDPLSRTARLGYSLEIGMNLKINRASLTFFKYTFTADAEDILIDDSEIENYTGEVKYQSGIGDIDISDHLIKLKADDKVYVHKGHLFSFFDTFTLAIGRFGGRNYTESNQTSGVGFTTLGLFKLINSLTENQTISYIARHFTIEYFYSNYKLGVDENLFGSKIVNFDGVSIHFKGFEI